MEALVRYYALDIGQGGDLAMDQVDRYSHLAERAEQVEGKRCRD